MNQFVVPQKREYIRVQKSTREALLNLVIFEGKKINEAAEALNIKYATAKTIVYQNKKKILKKTIHKEGLRECTYSCRSPKNDINIIVKVGGRVLDK